MGTDTSAPSLPTVLFVDDESLLLSSLKRLFRREPYTILIAVSGREAMEIMAHTTVDVLVVDLQMPDIDGYELLSKVALLHPQPVCLVMSAVTIKKKVEEVAGLRQVFKFISKPIHPDVLKRVIYHSVCHRAEAAEQPEAITAAEHLMLNKEDPQEAVYLKEFKEKIVCSGSGARARVS